MKVTCNPCHVEMVKEMSEPFGDVFRCRRCGQEVSINHSDGSILVDRGLEGEAGE